MTEEINGITDELNSMLGDMNIDPEKTVVTQTAEANEPAGKKPCPDCGKSFTWLADGSRPRQHKCVPKVVKEEVTDETLNDVLSEPVVLKPYKAPASGLVCSQCGKLQGTCEHHGKAGYTLITPDAFSVSGPKEDFVLEHHEVTREEVATEFPSAQPAPPPPPVIDKVTADKVVAAYVKTRDEIAAKTKAFNAELAPLNEFQEKRSNWLKGQLDANGLESMKTKFGTCFVDTKNGASVADWEIFIQWVKDNDAYEFLNHAVNKTAVKQRLEDKHPVPPGVNYTTFTDIKVRRA